MSEHVFKKLDEAVNKVINENFDLYFDEEKVNRLMKEWLTSRLEKVKAKERRS